MTKERTAARDATRLFTARGTGDGSGISRASFCTAVAGRSLGTAFGVDTGGSADSPAPVHPRIATPLSQNGYGAICTYY